MISRTARSRSQRFHFVNGSDYLYNERAVHGLRWKPWTGRADTSKAVPAVARWRVGATTGRGAQHPARFRRPLEDNRAMSSSSTKTAPYGSWRSPITSDLIVAQSITLSEVCLDGGHVYWLEGRPQEQGRYVVVRGNADGRPTDITPPPYNARTRVHEYGGGSWTVWNGTVYFSNFADGRLYRQVPGTSEPQALTPEPSARGRQWRFADGVIDQRRNRWIGVREDHTLDGEPVNAIVAVDLEGNAGPGRVLASGHDFYASPRLSPNGRWLTWLAWDHPNMPWNGTRLYLGEVTENGAISGPQPIAGGATESIFQPEWSPDSAQIVFRFARPLRIHRDLDTGAFLLEQHHRARIAAAPATRESFRHFGEREISDGILHRAPRVHYASGQRGGVPGSDTGAAISADRGPACRWLDVRGAERLLSTLVDVLSTYERHRLSILSRLKP